MEIKPETAGEAVKSLVEKYKALSVARDALARRLAVHKEEVEKGEAALASVKQGLADVAGALIDLDAEVPHVEEDQVGSMSAKCLTKIEV